MNYPKFLILTLIVSISFSQVSNTPKQKKIKINDPELQGWNEEDSKIDNPELQKILEELKLEFVGERDLLKAEHKKKVDLLKQEYAEKRKAIMKKYRKENRKNKRKKGKPINADKEKLKQEVKPIKGALKPPADKNTDKKDKSPILPVKK